MEQEKLKILPITFNIYAESEDEARRGRKAVVDFINIMGQHGARVSGNKLVEAVSKMETTTPFIVNQIIKFFKE